MSSTCEFANKGRTTSCCCFNLCVCVYCDCGFVIPVAISLPNILFLTLFSTRTVLGVEYSLAFFFCEVNYFFYLQIGKKTFFPLWLKKNVILQKGEKQFYSYLSPFREKYQRPCGLSNKIQPHSSRECEVSNQGTIKFHIWWEPAPSMAISPHGGKGDGAQHPLFYKGIAIYEGSSLITQGLYLLIQSHWGLSFNIRILGQTHFVYGNSKIQVN